MYIKIAGDEDASSVRPLKCCPGTLNRVVVCVKCGLSYHRSCFLKKKGVISQGDARVVCCSTSKPAGGDSGKSTPLEGCQKVSPFEYDLLKRLTEEISSKNVLLLEHKALLEDKIESLKKELERFRNPKNNAETSNITYSSVAKAVIPNITVTNSPGSSKPTVDSRITPTSELINGPVSDNRVKRPIGMVGTGRTSADFSAPPKRAWIYIGNCVDTVTKDNIAAYLADNNPNIEVLELEQLPTKGSRKAFKLVADFKHLQVLMSPDSWPERVHVRRFRVQRERSSSEAANFLKSPSSRTVTT